MSSGNNPLKPLKWYKDLADGKGRREAGVFLVEGERAIRQIAENQPDDIMEILAVVEPSAIYRRYNIRLVTAQQFDSISQAKTPQGMMAVIRLPLETYSDTLPEKTGRRVLFLEDVQDPGNVGTLIRTAAAFGFDGIILTEKCADPFSPKCVQSTAGSILSLWLRRTGNYLDIIAELKKSGFTIIAADLAGETLPSALPEKEKLVLALGNETAGLSESLLGVSDYRVRVPIAPEKAESLNVAVCGAVLMYLSQNSKLKVQN